MTWADDGVDIYEALTISKCADTDVKQYQYIRDE